jgi:hypothetical protein
MGAGTKVILSCTDRGVNVRGQDEAGEEHEVLGVKKHDIFMYMHLCAIVQKITNIKIRLTLKSHNCVYFTLLIFNDIVEASFLMK